MKRDPIHFFDDKGHSWLSRDHLAAENVRLEAEVARLKRLLVAQVKKNQAADPPEPAAPTIN